jgi:hypothetical protein
MEEYNRLIASQDRSACSSEDKNWKRNILTVKQRFEDTFNFEDIEIK